MLTLLINSPKLRQEASEKLLEIAKFLSVEELTEQYERVTACYHCLLLPPPPPPCYQARMLSVNVVRLFGGMIVVRRGC